MLAVKTFDTEYLEEQVGARAKEVHIRPEAWARFIEILSDLKRHNEFMYTHGLRVGLYSYGLAASEGQKDLKFPLFAGCGHDIGKCEVANTLLDSKHLRPEDFERIKIHTLEGYNKLKDEFPFAGFIAGLHHKYREDGYGIDLDTDAPFALCP